MYEKADGFVKRLRPLVIAEMETKEDNEELTNYDYVVDEESKVCNIDC